MNEEMIQDRVRAQREADAISPFESGLPFGEMFFVTKELVRDRLFLEIQEARRFRLPVRVGAEAELAEVQALIDAAREHNRKIEEGHLAELAARRAREGW